MYGMDDVLICQDTWAGTSKVVYTAVSQLAQFFVPVIIVICLYLSIYLKLKNRPQVSISSCQRNLIKTFQIEDIIALITKMDLIFS